jgi:hypothetical protein
MKGNTSAHTSMPRDASERWFGRAIKALVPPSLRGAEKGATASEGRQRGGRARLRGLLQRARWGARRQPQAPELEPRPEQDDRAEAEAPKPTESEANQAKHHEAQGTTPVRHATTELLFDGTEEAFRRWRWVGPGSLQRANGELQLVAGGDCSLAYYPARRFDSFRLRFQYCPSSSDTAATVAVRFLDPEEPVPDRDDPSIRYPYQNQAYVAPHTGFEVHLSSPDPGHEPGTFEGILFGDAPGAQLHGEHAKVKTGAWNELELEVQGEHYVARLNGRETSRFTNPDPYRGKPASSDPHAGFLGFFVRKGQLRLRNIEVEELRPERQARARQ